MLEIKKASLRLARGRENYIEIWSPASQSPMGHYTMNSVCNGDALRQHTNENNV